MSGPAASASIARLAWSRKTFWTSSASSALFEGRHRNDGTDLGVADDEAQALDRERGVERHIGGIGLHHRQHRDIGVGRLVEQQADPIAGLDALRDQMARDLIGAAVEIAIGQHDGVGDDGVTLGETGTGVFEKVIEPLALLPAHGVVGVFAGDNLRRTKAQSDRLSRAAQIRPQLRRRAQMRRRSAPARPMGAQIANVGSVDPSACACSLVSPKELSRLNRCRATPPYPREQR